MQLYWSGYGGVEISRRCGIPEGTIDSWIHNFGGQRERVKLPKLKVSEKCKSGLSARERFLAAENAEEWRKALQAGGQCEKVEPEEASIHLVCEKLRGQSVQKLTMVIFESLKENPQDGKSYAFCNKGGNIITTVAWEAPIFKISRYIKTSGTFIWPQGDFGKSIEVTMSEFEKLISFRKHKKHNKDRRKVQETLILCDNCDTIGG